MPSAAIRKKEVLSLLFAGLALVASLLYFDSILNAAVAGIIICSGVLTLYVAMARTYWLYLSLVFFIPLSVDIGIGGGAQANSPSELLLLLLLGVLMLFHAAYWKSLAITLKHPLIVLLVMDILWQLITSLTSSHIDVSLKRWTIHLIFSVGFVTSITMLKDPRRLVKVWMAYALGLIPVMWTTFLNFQRNDFNPRTVFSISEPFYPDHTVYGACLAFIIPLTFLIFLKRKQLSLRKWQSQGIFLLLLLLVASNFMALSRAAILSLAVAGLFALLLHWKMRFTGMVLGLAVLSGITFSLQDVILENLEKTEAVSNDGEVTNHLSSVTNIQTDASNLERVNRWVCALRMFEEQPLLGFGPGTYQFEYNKFQTIEFKTYISSNTGDKGNAHSEYLTYLSEKGLPGAIIFLLIVFYAMYVGMKNHDTLQEPLLRVLNLGVLLGLVTYFFHGIFNSFMDQSKMAFLYFTALGTLVWLSRDRKNHES